LVEAHLYHTLTQAGYDCHTVTFTLLYPSIFFPGKTQYDESKIIPYPHQERIYRLINSISPMSWFKTIKFIKEMGPDVVIFVWWMPFFGPAYYTIARGIKKGTGARIVFLVENFISHEKRWFDVFVARKTLGIADTFICQSGFIERQLRDNFPQIPVFRTTLSVYDCYDLKRYSKDEARARLGIQKSRMVLSFGLIRPYKGIKKLIKSFEYVVPRFADCELWIVGECYEDTDEYMRMIRSHPYASHIHFINKFIPNEELELYFRAADLVCLPYESGTQSGILMIAYAFGVPVLATSVGGIPELIKEGKTGRIIPDNQPETIARALISMLNEDLESYRPHIKDLAKTLGYKNLPEIISRIISHKGEETRCLDN